MDFTKEHYDALTGALSTHFDPDYVNDHRGAIKSAIINYFHQRYQHITIAIYDERIEITKVFAHPEKGEAYDRVLFLCDSKMLEIKQDPQRYRPAEVLWSLPYDRRKELFGFFDGMHLSVDEIKDILRERFTVCFELDDMEIVLFLRNNIYIRKHAVAHHSTSKERRFLGKDHDAIEKELSNHFPDGIWSEIKAILPETLEDRLNFTKIKNQRFNKTFIPVFRSMVEVVLISSIQNINEEDLLAFSGYVLRTYFDPILTFTAKELLKNIAERDKNAESFIKYYDGSVIINEDGSKLIHHAIVDSQHRIWNFSSILATLIQWKETKARMATYEEKLKELMERQESAQKSLGEYEPSKRQADIEINGVKNRVNDNRKRFNSLKRLAESSSEMMKKHRDELTRLRELDQSLINELRQIYEKHDKVLKTYNNRAKELNTWKKQISDHANHFKEVLEQNRIIKSNREKIVRAIVAVFAKR